MPKTWNNMYEPSKISQVQTSFAYVECWGPEDPQRHYDQKPGIFFININIGKFNINEKQLVYTFDQADKNMWSL